MSSNMEKLSWCPTTSLTPTEYYLWLGKVLGMLRRKVSSGITSYKSCNTTETCLQNISVGILLTLWTFSPGTEKGFAIFLSLSQAKLYHSSNSKALEQGHGQCQCQCQQQISMRSCLAPYSHSFLRSCLWLFVRAPILNIVWEKSWNIWNVISSRIPLSDSDHHCPGVPTTTDISLSFITSEDKRKSSPSLSSYRKLLYTPFRKVMIPSNSPALRHWP